MRRVIGLIVFWSCFLPLIGQVDDAPMVARHALIDSIYNLEQYPRVLKLVDIQIEEAIDTHWNDSLYLYMYPYGRALWKTQGQETGLIEAERFHEKLSELDPNPKHILTAYVDLSWLYYDAGDMQSCYRVDSTALLFARAHPEIPKELLAKHVTYMGFDNRALGNNMACIDWYLEAVEIFEGIDYDYKGKTLDHASAYNALAACQWHAGYNDKAGKNYGRSLDLLKDRTDTKALSFRASTLGNMAILYEDLGDYAMSRYYFEENIKTCNQTIAEFESPQEKEEMMYILSKTYSNLGATYYDAGQLDLSREYLDIAWNLRSQVFEAGDSRLEYLSNQRSVLEVALGNYEKADVLSSRYLKACIKDYGLTGEYTINGLMELASIKVYKEEYSEADSLFALILDDSKSLKDFQDSPWFGLAFLKKAELREIQGRYEEAISLASQALRIYRRAFPESHTKVQHAKLLKAGYLEKAGRKDEAILLLDDIILTLNTLRNDKEILEVEIDQRPEVLPTAIAARAKLRVGDDLGDQQNIEMALSDLYMAMEIIASDHKSMRGANATLTYTGRMSEIFDQAQELTYQLSYLKQDESLVSQVLSLSEKNKTVLLKNRLNAFESMSYSGVPDSLIAQERKLTERLGQGLIGDELTLDEAQIAYTTLFEKLKAEYPRYFELRYGDADIKVSDIQSDLLEVGQTLLSFSMHEDGVILVMVDKTESKMLKLVIEELPEQIESLNADVMNLNQEGYNTKAFSLYESLFSPAVSFIKGEEVIIIPDDELFLLNFELLIDKPATAGNEISGLLLNKYTISYILSAATALQFERIGDKHGKGILALAPGFSDEMKEQYVAQVNDSSHLDNAYLRLIKQPFSVSTAQGLGDLMSARVLTGMDASEDRFKEEADRYGVIHLGTHTEVNDVSPLFSKLFLSKSDSTAEDGYLHAYEIYDMELKAELAVLTACETGAGKKAKAEGLRSLAHGFAYAGCPSVIMSLWKIDEKTTAEITDSFYGYLADGTAKNVALRQAKLDFIANNPELNAPYYWAGIVLMGDESPIQVASRLDWRYLLGAIVLITLLFLLYRKIK